MTAILRVDSLGKRYGLLPSEVMQRADTFDIFVIDAVMSFEDYYKKKSNNKHGLPPAPDYTQEELLNMLGKS